jgi:hypothetical protein
MLPSESRQVSVRHLPADEGRIRVGNGIGVEGEARGERCVSSMGGEDSGTAEAVATDGVRGVRVGGAGWQLALRRLDSRLCFSFGGSEGAREHVRVAAVMHERTCNATWVRVKTGPIWSG